MLSHPNNIDENRILLQRSVYFLVHYKYGVKDHTIWNPITCKLLVYKDVSFNETISSKNGENSQVFPTSKSKSIIPNHVEEEINHEGFYDRREKDATRMEEEEHNVVDIRISNFANIMYKISPTDPLEKGLMYKVPYEQIVGNLMSVFDDFYQT